MNMERLAQSETYYPGYQEAHSGVTAVAFGIRRVSDGQWYDFNDSTFKASGWTTKHQALAEDDNGLWTYDTGWAIPNSNAIYHLQWKVTDATGTYYELGPKIVVNDTYMVTAANNGAAVLSAIVEGTLELKQAIQAIMAFTATKVTGGGTTTITFRDHADSKNRVVMTVDANGDRSNVTYSFD